MGDSNGIMNTLSLYFDELDDSLKLAMSLAKDMGAVIVDKLDDNPKYALFQSPNMELCKKVQSMNISCLQAGWIMSCFKEKQLVPTKSYEIVNGELYETIISDSDNSDDSLSVESISRDELSSIVEISDCKESIYTFDDDSFSYNRLTKLKSNSKSNKACSSSILENIKNKINTNPIGAINSISRMINRPLNK